MICIVGLGNPGEKYQYNRHNVGFQFIDYLIENLKNPCLAGRQANYKIKIQKNLSSIIYHLSSNLILAKPLTFMNKSGEAVQKIIGNWKLKIENLVVVHDDLDIPLGKFKIQKGTGPELHNGIKSIEEALKTKPSFAKASEGKDFWRIRIGVDARPARRNLDEGGQPDRWIDGETYVLHDFLPSEKDLLNEDVFPEILSRLQSSVLKIDNRVIV